MVAWTSLLFNKIHMIESWEFHSQWFNINTDQCIKKQVWIQINGRLLTHEMEIMNPKLFKCRVKDHLLQFKNNIILRKYIVVTRVELSLASYELKYIHIFTIITGSYSNSTHQIKIYTYLHHYHHHHYWVIFELYTLDY